MSKTNVYFVCDCSGSMAGDRERAMRELLVTNIRVLADAERVHKQSYEIQLIPFSNNSRSPFPFMASDGGAERAVSANVHTNSPFGGGTALLDAIGLALDKADKALSAKHCDAALVMTFTDGQENGSVAWSRPRLRAEIQRLERDGRITLTFAGPASSLHFMQDLGVSQDNFKSWDGSVAELKQVERATTGALSTYTTARSTGATRADRLYADASQLTASGIKANTAAVVPTEISVVTKRMAGRTIADYFGNKFQQGKHFYELVKAEYIQDGKDLVVFIKSQNEYRLGSRSVRTLLKLPEAGKIRVHPSSNSSDYTIFVRSESNNRKVVEGQQLLTVEA